MRGLRALFLLGLVLPLPAGALDITRVCFPGFCLESNEAFTVTFRNPAKRDYRLLHSETQSTLYLRAGEELPFPHCDTLCTETQTPTERRSRHNRTGILNGRLLGPFEACDGGKPFFIHLYAYFPAADLRRFRVERVCG